MKLTLPALVLAAASLGNPAASALEHKTGSDLRQARELTQQLQDQAADLGTEEEIASIDDPGAVITNGVIKLGLNKQGHLITARGSGNPLLRVVDQFGEPRFARNVGLRYIFPGGADANNNTESEGVAWGILYEGWGATADREKVFFNRREGESSPDGDYSTDFISDESTATSVVSLESGTLKVTHDFRPSPVTDNLYEIMVTLENTSGGVIDNVGYRRVIDWDIYPSLFENCVTIQPDPSSIQSLVTATNGEFPELPSDPDDALEGETAPLSDFGLADVGAGFDFQFGSVDAGNSITFNLYYGAAGSQAEAGSALAAVSAEVYSLAKPNDGRVCTDAPNVYIMAFTGVGGDELFTPAPSMAPSTSLAPSATKSGKGEGKSGKSGKSSGSLSLSLSMDLGGKSSKSTAGKSGKATADAVDSTASRSDKAGKTMSPTSSPTESPTGQPTVSASPTVTVGPSNAPSVSNVPSLQPTGASKGSKGGGKSSKSPTLSPTGSPTGQPTVSASPTVTVQPSPSPVTGKAAKTG